MLLSSVFDPGLFDAFSPSVTCNKTAWSVGLGVPTYGPPPIG